MQNPISSTLIVNGKISEAGIAISKLNDSNHKTKQTCTDWYLVTTYFFSDGTTETEVVYLYTSCSEDCGIAGPGGRVQCGGGGGSGTGQSNEQSPNKLCGTYEFTRVGSGLTAEIVRLIANAHHNYTNNFLNVMWGAMCVTFGSSTPNSSVASQSFNLAWNLTMDEAQYWLNSVDRVVTEIELSNFIKEQLRINLQIYSNGYVRLATGPCIGGVASTTTRYC
jgi:hypothetical protein